MGEDSTSLARVLRLMTALHLLACAGGVVGLVIWWSLLDGLHLAGVSILGLVFAVLVAAGLHADCSGRLASLGSGRGLALYYVRKSSIVYACLCTFLAGLWLLVLLAWSLPGGSRGLGYVACIVGFTWLVWLFIKLAAWVTSSKWWGGAPE